MADIGNLVAQQTAQQGGVQGAGLSDAVQSGIQAAQMEQQIAGQKQAQQSAAIDLQGKQASQLAGDARRVVWAPSNLQGSMLDQMEQRAQQAQIPFDRTALEQVLKDPDQVNHIRSSLNDLATGKVSADPDFLMQTLGTVPGMTDYLQQTMGANSKIQNAAQAKLTEDRQKQDNEMAMGQQKGGYELQNTALKGQYEVKAAQAKQSFQAYGKVADRLEQMRGNPAVQQAEKDLYAGSKVNEVLSGNLNEKTPAEVLLATSEVAKIASGGVPTESEMHGITPNGYSMKVAEAWQKLSNKPNPANQGALLEVLKNYNDKLQGGAQKVVTDRYGRILGAAKDQISADQYQTLDKQYTHRFDQPGATLSQPAPAGQTQAPPAQQASPAQAGPKTTTLMANPKFQQLSPQQQAVAVKALGGQ